MFVVSSSLSPARCGDSDTLRELLGEASKAVSAIFHRKHVVGTAGRCETRRAKSFLVPYESLAERPTAHLVEFFLPSWRHRDCHSTLQEDSQTWGYSTPSNGNAMHFLYGILPWLQV
jgi:hypothetical protein